MEVARVPARQGPARRRGRDRPDGDRRLRGLSAPTGYRLRNGRDDDASPLCALEARADRLFRSVGIDVAPQGASPPEEPLRQAFGEGLLLVGETEAGELAGFLAAAPLDAALHILTLAVDPAHMRRGLGRALMTGALEHAAWAFWPAVTLTTFRDVPWNAPFYRRLGFLAADEGLLAPGLAAARARERAIGLDALGPRLAMARAL